MINFDQDKQRIWQEIHDVLLNVWDLIGVSDIESAQDEYDSYIGKIYALLLKGANAKRLERHLWWIESIYMGLPQKAPGRDLAVKALLRIELADH